MAYQKTSWLSGDVITAEKMNKIEDGIYQAQEAAASAKTYTAGNGISISIDGVISLNLQTWTGGSY